MRAGRRRWPHLAHAQCACSAEEEVQEGEEAGSRRQEVQEEAALARHLPA